MSFSQQNPFNADANFTSIKFGVNKPVLEVELNELQSITRNRSKEAIKSLFGNGVIGKGTYNFTSNTFTLSNEVAVLEGDLLKIDSVSITASNGDTIYLQSWIEEKSFEDTIKKYGNSTSASTVANTIKDTRINMETSRREQLLYSVSNTLDGTKNSLKLGRIVNDTFILDCPVINALSKHYETVQGSYVTVNNTQEGFVELEVLGNTVQDSSNLADIKSVGVAREDGNYEIELKSCGKNLFNKETAIQDSYIVHSTGVVQGGNSMYCASDFIPVKPNTKYYKTDATAHYCYFDKNKKVIPPSENIGTNILTTPGNAYFMRITVHKATINAHQLEEGTVATSYEPYQGTTSKVILPCQLEKVGDVSDRLFRREDGVWCIEKKIQEITLNGTENWIASGSGNSYRLLIDLENLAIKTDGNVLGNIMSTKFPTVSYNDMYNGNVTKGIAVYNVSSKLALRNNDITTLVDFKSYLQTNNIKVKFEAIVPKVIELPLENQIQLNSYFGTTQVFIESGEVDGTIKCTIPKSLGASINSLNSKADSLQQRVEKIENLQKGNEMQVSTNKASVVVEDTNEGYITDFEIKGDTLVNLTSGKIQGSATAYNGTAFTTNSAQNRVCVYANTIKENTNYTIISFDPTVVSTGNYFIGTSASEFITKSVTTVNNRYLVNSLNAKSLAINLKKTDDSNFATCDILILEGDHTDKDISYFEGLKSVGDGVDKVEVLSRKDKGNLFDTTSLLPITITTGVAGKSGYNKILLSSDDFYFYVNSSIGEIINGNIAFRFKDKNGNDIGTQFTTTNRLNGKGYVSLKSKNIDYKLVDTIELFWNNIAPSCTITEIGIYNTSDFTEKSYVINKKELLYKNAEGLYEKPVLRKVSDTIYDTIELHSDGKYYYHKRCNEVVLNGSEGWYIQGDYSKYIEIINYTPTPKVDQKGVCDKLPTGNSIKGASTHNPIEIGIYGNGQLRVKPYDKDNMTLEEGKAWLESNTPTYIYALATEEVYECTNIDLNAYDDTTFISLETGYINPQFSAKVSKHIGNVVNQIKEKTDNLEEKVGKLVDERTKGYTSNKGYVVAEDTTDSYIENVKVEGNTLVNLLGKITSCSTTGVSYTEEGVITFKQTEASTGANPKVTFGNSIMEVDKTYTLIFNITKNTLVNTNSTPNVAKFNLTSYNTGTYLIPQGATGIQVVALKQPSVSTGKAYVEMVSACVGELIIQDCLVIEGDYTNNPPSYFEGLLSTGQDVEVMDLTSTNCNLDNSFNEFKEINLNTGVEIASKLHVISTFNSAFTDDSTVTFYENGVATSDTITRRFYDINKKYLGSVYTKDAFYVRYRCLRNNEYPQDITCYEFRKPSYNNYMEDTKQLLYKNSEGEFIPIPALRKVGDMRDTIELHSDGKYYYHKRCREVTLNGSEEWKKANDVYNQINARFSIEIDDMAIEHDTYISSKVICDRFPSIPFNVMYNQDVPGVAIWYMKPTLSIRSYGLTDLNTWKSWLQQNPTTVVYALATEEVYECNNLDLNSYEGETLVQINSGVICPSKLSFTMDSDLLNLVDKMKEEVDKNTKFREEMTESVTLTREFENGYEVFEDTREGSVSIDKIEGKTLVSPIRKRVDYFPSGGTSSTIKSDNNVTCYEYEIKPNTTYTVQRLSTSDRNVVALFSSNSLGSATTLTIMGDATNYKPYTITTGNNDRYLLFYVNTTLLSNGVSTLVVEGDHTQNPPSYFEGLKSVGDLEDLEIKSRKEDGNLFNSIWESGKIDTTTGQDISQEGNFRTTYINVPSSTIIYTNFAINLLYYDENKHFISYGSVITENKYFTTPSNCRYIRLFRGSIPTNEVLSIDRLIPYMSHKGNKKQLFIQNKNGIYEKPILRGLPNGVKDTIEKHSDGKYYYHKRCGEAVLNGSENWLLNVSSTTTQSFRCSYNVAMTGNLLCDKFLQDSSSGDGNESILVSKVNTPNEFSIEILKTKLSSVDVTGFKAWLSSNPVTVVYELATEEVYECVNLDLDSYEGETSIIFPSVIPAKIKASVGSNLLATIESLKGRVEYLETEFSDKSENGSGWCKLPNGMIMQYGKTSYTPVGQKITVTYPLTFKTCYSVQLTGMYNATTNHYWVVGGLNGNVLTGFSAYKNGDTVKSDDVFWLAIGEV